MRHPRGRSKKSPRPRKTETENPTPAAHLRSSKGRRPPYFPLKPSRPIDEVPIEELELCDIVSLRAYEDGTAQTQGIRAWNEEHEAILRWTYAPGSPCIIDPTDPDQHLSFLSELGFASRDRGRSAVEGQAQSVHLFFNTTDYENCRTQWKTLSTKDQEEIILKTLADLARAEEREGNEIEHEGFFLRNRRLTPELTLSSLCADEGDGLLRWFDLLEEYTRDSTALGERPIPHKEFFAKFAIPSEGSPPSIPLSQADRAFQAEYLLRRHSLLFQFSRRLMNDILGLSTKIKSWSKVGNVRSEITSNNDPFLADEGNFGETGPLPKRYGYFCDEACSLCQNTAEKAGVPRLLYCARCKKVSRVHPYCSEHCQKTDWMHHRTKGHCGSRLSDFLSIPVVGDDPSRTPSASTSTSSDLSPLRQSVLKLLDRRPDAMWAVPSAHPPYLLIHIDNDNATEVKIRNQVRSLAYRALKESDQTSIYLLARTMINPTYIRRRTSTSNTHSTSERPTGDETETGLIDIRQCQFRQMFDLENDSSWIEALEAGEAELDKEENELLRRYVTVAFKQSAARHTESKRLRVLDQMTPSLPRDAPPEIANLARFFTQVMLGPRAGQTSQEMMNEALRIDDQGRPLPESTDAACKTQ